VTFDRLETSIFDQADQFSLGHLYFVVSLDGITGGQLATFRDCAVDIVRAVMQCHLRQTFAEHYPIRFDVIEVVEHQTRNSHCLQRVDAAWTRQMRELRLGRIERQRYEALKTTG